MSMKNSDTIRNRSRDLPVCSAVTQPLRYRVQKIFDVQLRESYYRSLVKTTGAESATDGQTDGCYLFVCLLLFSLLK
jgi:hypothetical protein